jgi:hypothetical protein
MRTIEEITAEITMAKRMNSCGKDYKRFIESSYYKGLLEELEVATSAAESNDSAKATDVSAVSNTHEARVIKLLKRIEALELPELSTEDMSLALPLENDNE